MSVKHWSYQYRGALLDIWQEDRRYRWAVTSPQGRTTGTAESYHDAMGQAITAAEDLAA